MLKFITYLVIFMEIYCNTKKIANLCNNKQQAEKQLGTKNAKALFSRLIQLKSVNQLGEFKFDKPHPLKGERKTEFAITICAGYRLTFKAVKPEYNNTENFKWTEVTEINIVYIGDYHG